MEERLNGNGETVLEEKAAFRKVLVGGDQLTSVRARSAIKIKTNSQTPCKKLSGIVPVVEDWHTKVCLLSVSQVVCNLY